MGARKLKTTQAFSWRDISVMFATKIAKEATIWKDTERTLMKRKKIKVWTSMLVIPVIKIAKEATIWRDTCWGCMGQNRTTLKTNAQAAKRDLQISKIVRNTWRIASKYHLLYKTSCKGRVVSRQRDLPWLPLAAHLWRRDSKSSSCSSSTSSGKPSSKT